MTYTLFSRRLLQLVFRYLLTALIFILPSPVCAAEDGFAQLTTGYHKCSEANGNKRDAIAELKRKAEQGDAEAQFLLGRAYAKGDAVSKDHEESVTWFRKAAEQGNVEAQFFLAAIYSVGIEGVPKDSGEAVKWCRKAAEQGHAKAQGYLGSRYYRGEGVVKNYAQAMRWFQKAAEQGDAGANYYLGMMHYYGEGTSKNYTKAVKWYRKAAEQGDVRGQTGLGGMYLRGEGVRKNASEAVKWFRKAAEQGYESGESQLGIMYYYGLGVPQNYVQAYFWSNLAAAKGNVTGKIIRDDAASLMTPGQIAQAQEMSANWKPKTAPSEQATRQFGLSSGTGFIVSREGHIVTNHHIIEGCTKIVCKLAEKSAILSLIHKDEKNDLALLKLDSSAPLSLKFREGKSIRSGDGVVVLGFPLQEILSNEAHVTTGTVSAMAGPGNDARILQITAPVQPGNSGGPILDLAGYVVGIVTAKLNAIKAAKLTGDIPQNVNFGINAAVVKAFLDANGVDYESASSNKKLETSEIGEFAKKATVLIGCSE